MRRGLVVALLLTAALAGCVERARLPPIDGTAGPGRVVVDDAPPGRTVELLVGDRVIADARPDAAGSAVFVGLDPGDGYRVRLARDDLRGPASARIAVGPRAPVLVGNATAAIVAAAEPDATLVVARNGTGVAEVAADDDGRRVIRNLTAGTRYTVTQTVLGIESPSSPTTSVAPAAVGGDGRVTVAGAQPGATILLLNVEGPPSPDPRRDPVLATDTAGQAGTVTFNRTDAGDALPPGPGYYALQRDAGGATRPSNVVVVT